MQLTNNEVLITGGASGIGLGLARMFLEAGSRVIVCGRREKVLGEAQKAHPGLLTFPCDLTRESERIRLAEWISSKHSSLNVLVNNAGIQQRVSIADKDFWTRAKEEIAINWEAPVHLTFLLLDVLKKARRAFIINVSSGLAFVPLAAAPVYCATKAAMHSFTRSLRPMLRGTDIGVIELIPPAVRTDLGGPGLHTSGTRLEEFIGAAVAQLRDGKNEISYGFSERMSHGSREELQEAFQRMNGEKP